MGFHSARGGGIKMTRWILVFKSLKCELVKILHPNAVMNIKIDNSVVPTDVLRQIFVFIYRETFVLTIFGSLLGLILGVFLHRFVIYTAQTGSVLFLYNIEWYSYVISVIITVILSLIVQLIINKTIKKIDMIDSLKYVE